MVLHVVERFLDLLEIIVFHKVTPQGGCAYFTQGNRVSVKAIRVFADAPVRSDVIEIAAVKIGVKIARAIDVAWLAGYTDFSYCRKCLRKLQQMGLLQITRGTVGANCYYLSGRGLKAIGKGTSHPYEISYTTNHALLVGRVCSWLKITEGADPNAMLTDAILRANGANQRHRPDIVLGRKAFEVELNHKPLRILEKNIQDKPFQKNDNKERLK